MQLLQEFIKNCWEQADTTKIVFEKTRIHLTAGVKKL